MNVLTMTLEEIYALEHVTVTENDYYVYITPDAINGYYLEIEDTPEPKTYFNTVEMLKQDRYSDITVKSVWDPSTSAEIVDSSDLSVWNLEKQEELEAFAIQYQKMIDSSNGWD